MNFGISHIRRPLSWMLLCIYGLLFSAGYALHLVPGFEHSHGPGVCSHDHDQPSHDHTSDKTDTNCHSRSSSSTHPCCHHHEHASTVDEHPESKSVKRPANWVAHHDCSICKLLAVSLVVCEPISLPVLGDATSPWVAFFTPGAFLEPVSIETVRGPPTLI